MNLYAIRRRDFWGTPEELQATAAKSAQVGEEMSDDVRWIRTYVVKEDSGKLGTVCLYQGTSAEKVREQAERTGMPADEITLVEDTVIVRPDPVRLGSAYQVWDRLEFSPDLTGFVTGPTLMSITRDFGRTWSTPKIIVNA